MNYYLTGITGMPKLLDCCDDPLKHFKKNIYAEEFQRMYQQNFQTLDAIEKGYNSVVDQDQFLTNMAEALSDHAQELVDGCKKKSSREQKLINLNMTMVVFVLPMILEYKGKSSKPLTDRLLEAWKKRFPKTNIQATTFEDIEKGFHKKFCYITTAVCESFGREDDCRELLLLRDYRDNYLMKIPGGEQMVQEYYDVAPSIVKHIDRQENSEDIYRSIWEMYISPCISMIHEGEMEKCRELYQKMVCDLKEQYFLS